jgi:hypothetical protein
LCDDCEERFNSGGERWILRNYLKPSGEFALRDALRAARPSDTLDTARIYPGNTPGVDVDKLVYFATSLIWRVAVHDWSEKYGLGQRLDLGPYEEHLRNFLLGLKDFPDNGCMIVYVSDDDTPPAGATSPVRVRTDENYFQYSFHIPGLMFFLLLGQLVPTDIQQHLCAVRSPERVVFLTKQVGELFRKAAVTLRSRLPASELSKYSRLPQ